MNALTFLFVVLAIILVPVKNSRASNCPVGLPTEVHIDCIIAETAAEYHENDAGYFGSDDFNITERLQAWVDRQMQGDFAREDEESHEPSGVARQTDRP